MTIKQANKIKTKAQARQFAIDWQNWVSEQNLSYLELDQWADVFCRLGKKYKLYTEFQENGII